MKKRIVTIEINLTDDSSLDDDGLADEIEQRLYVRGGIKGMMLQVQYAAIGEQSAHAGSYTVKVETQGESKS